MERIKDKRNENIDIIKGTCIILMVLGHTSFIDIFACGTIYLFHMAVFFIASGFLLKDKYFQSIKTMIVFLSRKIKGLWLPFFLYTESFIILNNVF